MVTPEALREVVDALAASTDKDEIASLVMAVATGAADATAENCARALESVIPEVEKAFPVPPGQVAVAPLSATFQMIRGLAAAMREIKSDPAIGAPPSPA